jgi:hypothetical protein
VKAFTGRNGEDSVQPVKERDDMRITSINRDKKWGIDQHLLPILSFPLESHLLLISIISQYFAKEN